MADPVPPTNLEYARLDARERFWKRAITLAGLLIVVLLIGIVSWHLINRAFATSTITQNTTAFISSIRSEAKYVVASQSLAVTIERAKEHRGWWGLYLGTSTARIRVDDCRVQYIIPTDQINVDDFVYDRNRSVLTVTLPKPILDQNIVDVPSDPSKWWTESSSGWAKFDKADVLKEAQQAVRNEALVAAYQRGFDEATEAVAVKRLKESLRKWLKQSDLAIEVIFRDRRNAPPGR